MRADQKQKREVYYYILAYLSDNADAGDTFDGIAEWWLLYQRVKFETRNVSEAVAELVSEGLLVGHKGADSHVIYRVNRSKEQTIRSILSQQKGSPRR